MDIADLDDCIIGTASTLEILEQYPFLSGLQASLICLLPSSIRYKIILREICSESISFHALSTAELEYLSSSWPNLFIASKTHGETLVYVSEDWS